MTPKGSPISNSLPFRARPSRWFRALRTGEILMRNSNSLRLERGVNENGAARTRHYSSLGANNVAWPGVYEKPLGFCTLKQITLCVMKLVSRIFTTCVGGECAGMRRNYDRCGGRCTAER